MSEKFLLQMSNPDFHEWRTPRDVGIFDDLEAVAQYICNVEGYYSRASRDDVHQVLTEGYQYSDKLDWYIKRPEEEKKLGMAEETFLILRELTAHSEWRFTWSQAVTAYDAVKGKNLARCQLGPLWGSKYDRQAIQMTVGNFLRAQLAHGTVIKLGRGQYKIAAPAAKSPVFLNSFKKYPNLRKPPSDLAVQIFNMGRQP